MRSQTPPAPLLRSFMLLVVLLGSACRTPVDPIVQDPGVVDAEHRASLVELSFGQADERMNGIAYLAQGAGPHPTVLLLHGYPGNERNLDLAQALRRTGWNVVFFHYRGAWGSGGRFSLPGAIEDAHGVLATLREPSFAARHRIDTGRLAVVGHSMGGFVTLMVASEDPRLSCAVSLAGANLGLLGRGLAADPEAAAAAGEAFEGWSGPIRGPSGAQTIETLVANAERFDLLLRVPVLASKRLLLVAGSRDTDTPLGVHHAPLVAALQAARAPHLDEQVFDADHSFSDKRLALARRVAGWLDTSCAR